MKIVTLIPSYSPKPERIPLVLNEIKLFSDRTIIFAAEEYDFGPEFEVVKYDKSIKDDLVFEPRKWIEKNLEEDWDFVLYNEDDILITEKVFRSALKFQESLTYPNVVGFNRFEFHNGEKHWIDQHPAHGVWTNSHNKSIIVKNEIAWVPANFHSGNFLLPKDYARKLISSGRFDTTFKDKGISYCGKAESGATSIYRTLIKNIPLDFESVQCQHLDNKYCFSPGTPTTEILKKMLS